ncbi:MAG TPA: DUF805 domain-containing protein [Alphaproteobacteria bacterium]|nr:DUF805 domain-containing protein [Alphaproteobacteria bacterium]
MRRFREGFRRYFEFGGRSSRLDYLMFIVGCFVVGFFLAMVDVFAGTYDPGSGAGLLSSIFQLAVLIPVIAVSVRRLHDFDASGWWYLLMLIPVVNIVLFLVLLFKPGTDGPNRFGPDPRNQPPESWADAEF